MFNAIALFIALPVTILVAAFIVMAAKSGREDVAGFDEPNLSENKLLWGTTFGLALVYLMAGIPKLAELGPMVNLFTSYGYSTEFMWVIGALEVAGAILLVFRRTAWLSASGLSILAGGSLYTHLAAGEYLASILPLACFAGLVYVAFRRFPRGVTTNDHHNDHHPTNGVAA